MLTPLPLETGMVPGNIRFRPYRRQQMWLHQEMRFWSCLVYTVRMSIRSAEEMNRNELLIGPRNL